MSQTQSLFDIQTHTQISYNGQKFSTRMKVEFDWLKFQFAVDGSQVGSMSVQVSHGNGRIANMAVDREYRPDAHVFMHESAKLAKASRVSLVANLNKLIPAGTVEKKRRKMFVSFSKLFKRAGFTFTSTYSLVYGAGAKQVVKNTSAQLAVLTKPIKDLTYHDIKQPKHFWQSLTEEQLEEYKYRCFKVFRREGFPYVSTSRGAREAWLRALMNTDINLVNERGEVGQNLTGLSLAWSFHPHAWSVPCNKGFMTVMDAFNNDDKLKLLVKRLIDFYPVMSKTNLFGRIKMLSGVQAVSNFRPTAAAALYEYFGGGTIQDMSGGWGGRMLGAYRAPSVKRYIATEPSTLTHKGLLQQAEFLTQHRLFVPTEFEVHKLGSEVFRPDKNSIDFAFTSPPYFNCEQYSEEKTQSFKKFPEYSAWADGFLGGTFRNVWYGLKPGCHMAINIANIKGAGSIEEDTVRVAKEVGFKHVRTMYLTLSRAGSGFKLEPIFVFKKPVPKRG